jgi:hypothetical protein
LQSNRASWRGALSDGIGGSRLVIPAQAGI